MWNSIMVMIQIHVRKTWLQQALWQALNLLKVSEQNFLIPYVSCTVVT